ncbi:MAG: hypothetical protein WC789_08265 [Lentisphaeria bacterium]|jgi:hypothetical protein
MPCTKRLVAVPASAGGNGFGKGKVGAMVEKASRPGRFGALWDKWFAPAVILIAFGWAVGMIVSCGRPRAGHPAPRPLAA